MLTTVSLPKVKRWQDCSLSLSLCYTIIVLPPWSLLCFFWRKLWCFLVLWLLRACLNRVLIQLVSSFSLQLLDFGPLIRCRCFGSDLYLPVLYNPHVSLNWNASWAMGPAGGERDRERDGLDVISRLLPIWLTSHNRCLQDIFIVLL